MATPHTSFGLRRSLLGALLGLALVGPQVARADGAPVTLIVGYAAGGPVDTAARQFAPVFSKELGRPVIVENRPGAAGAIGGAFVAHSAPDQQLLYFAASPTVTITPHVIRNMPFDPVKDLAPVSPLLAYTNVLVVNKSQPFKTVAELIAYAKANPGKVTYGSAGMGASNHLSGELFAIRTGTKLTHVPYKGNAPAMTDVIGGQISMMFDIISTARNYIHAGKVNALAVTSVKRNPSLPDVPSMKEAGIPDYDVQGWYALYGPTSLPADQIARYNDAARKALANADLKKKYSDQGYDLWVGSPKDVGERTAKELSLWGTVTKGIKFE